MNSLCWRLSLSFCSLAPLCLLLPACTSDGHISLFGYSSAPLYDMTIRTVYVPQVENETKMHGSLQFDVTRAIITEIHLRTPYRVVHDRAKADTELICKIKNRSKVVNNIQQLGETREAQVGMNFEVIWRDLRKGHEDDVLSQPKRPDNEVPAPIGPDGKPVKTPVVLISPVVFYIPEVGGSDASARAQIYKNLAIQVANMMETTGKGWR